ncbi:hypothetical protein [Campylobacter sp. LR286c]
MPFKLFENLKKGEPFLSLQILISKKLHFLEIPTPKALLKAFFVAQRINY